MAAPVSDQSEDLARRVYGYFIFRLRQPADAERLARLTFERISEAQRMGRATDRDAELPVFAAARAVIADNPRPRSAVRVGPTRGQGQQGDSAALSNALAMAVGRLHGRERDALALRFGAELSVGEIAELLDRTPAEVKQRLARGTRMLLQLGVLPKDGKTGSAEGTRAGGPEQGEAEQDQADS
jgi:RNA polymerase sigma factor (sigma-70 family)